MITQKSFNELFPELADPSDYPPAQFAIWSAVAYKLLNACRWGDQLDLAASLFTAHHLVIARRRAMAADRGGVPGELQGPKTGASVDKVSKSMDPSLVSFENQGFWGLTDYGIQLLTLVDLFGAGPIQITGGVSWGPQGTGPLNGFN